MNKPIPQTLPPKEAWPAARPLAPVSTNRQQSQSQPGPVLEALARRQAQGQEREL